MIVAVSGSRNLCLSGRERVCQWLNLLREGTKGALVVIEGGCPTGADQIARAWADHYNLPRETYTADWKLNGKAAGPIRNQRMVDRGPDLLLAFPQGASPGTRDMIRRAKAASIPTIVEEQPE